MMTKGRRYRLRRVLKILASIVNPDFLRTIEELEEGDCERGHELPVKAEDRITNVCDTVGNWTRAAFETPFANRSKQ